MRGGPVRLACLSALLGLLLCAPARRRRGRSRGSSTATRPPRRVPGAGRAAASDGTLHLRRHAGQQPLLPHRRATASTNERRRRSTPSRFSVKLGNVNRDDTTIRASLDVLRARAQQRLQPGHARQRHRAVHALLAGAGRGRADPPGDHGREPALVGRQAGDDHRLGRRPGRGVVSRALLETTAPMRSDPTAATPTALPLTASTRPRWCARATAAPTPARATPAAR